MRYVVWSLAVLTIGLGRLAVPAQPNEDAKLAAFFKRYLEAEFAASPTYATRLGDHRFDDKLDDLSAEALAANLARTRAALAELPKQVDYQKLTRDGQIDYEILQGHLQRSLWLADNTNVWANDPRIYNEYTSDSVFLILTQSTLPQPRNVQNAISRIREIPKILTAAKANLKNPPAVMVETAKRQNQGAINFYAGGILEVAGEKPGSDLDKAAKAVVPALREYQQFLETELAPRANGEWRLGKERFAKKLELELEADVNAEQVLKQAEAEVERVTTEMYVIARQLWQSCYPEEPLPPDDPAGRRETIRRVLAHLSQDHGEAKDLVRDARATVKDICDFIRQRDILRLPEPDRCQIIEMPEFQRGNSVAYLNPAPPLDPTAVSHYAISPPPRDWDARRVQSYLEEYNRAMLQLLTIHEAYPGHYVQLEYSNRHPSLIRRVLYSGTFAEGWAVYTEQMLLDQGYGRGNLSLRLHQLKWYLRAVVNAILDYRMHCTNMTDEEAMRLLVEVAFQSEAEAIGKIIRAKQSSCQLSTYFVGRMAFYRLRQAIAREQGPRFHLGRFHEAVLAHGTLPVRYLPELTRARLALPR
jgi:uncharacterized protein (DUF885 family)